MCSLSGGAYRGRRETYSRDIPVAVDKDHRRHVKGGITLGIKSAQVVPVSVPENTTVKAFHDLHHLKVEVVQDVGLLFTI